MIYVDHAATTYVKKEVLDAMLPYFSEKFGNASSGYKMGGEAREAIERSRRIIAEKLNAKPEEIYFVSSGSEADNMIIKGIARANKLKGNHIITSNIEHHAVFNTCKQLEEDGFEVSYISPREDGIINPDDVRKEIKESTILISIMMANNEIGTIQPVKEIAKIAKFKDIYFHSDAVQAIGNIEIDVKDLDVDALSMSAHKFYGPKGVGVCYIKNTVKFDSLVCGGHQERDKRAGTENTAGIVGTAKAFELATTNIALKQSKLIELREYTMNRLISEIQNVKINGSVTDRLPGNVNVSFKNTDGKALLILLDLDGIAASQASACNHDKEVISHVLKAINVDNDYALGTIRITYGEDNTKEEAKAVVDSIVLAVEKVRNLDK